MFYVLSILSFLIYAFLICKLFMTSLLSSLSTGNYLLSSLKLIVIVFLLYEILIEWRVYLSTKKSELVKRHIHLDDLKIFMSVFLGTLVSYYLNHNFALGAVVASSLVGLIGGLLLSKYAVPIYCGSFAGMVSSTLTSDPTAIFIIGIFAALLYVFGSQTFVGFGGKLGATAYFATLLTSVFYQTFRDTMIGSSITIQSDVFIVFIIGSLGTYLINEQYDIGVVTASSLLGLTFGLILPNVFSHGGALAVALFCGTFIGMSTSSKLSTRVSVLIATIIGTIIYLYTAPYFAGLGGKLGLIAFGSSIATSGIYNFRTSLSKHRKKQLEG